LRDVTVGVPPGGRGTPIEIPESELRLDFGGWLPSRHLVNLRTRGLQLDLSRQGSHIRVGALLRREGAPGELRGAGRFRDDGSSGRLWLSGQNLDLGALLAGVDLGGYDVQAGHGNVAAWLDWKQGKVVRNFTRL